MSGFGPFNANGNYWGYTGEDDLEEINSRLVPDELFTLTDYENEAFELCGSGDLPDLSSCEEYWNDALIGLETLDFSTASQKFTSIVSSFPDCKYALTSATQVLLSELQLGTSPGAIRTELLSLAASATETDLKNRLAASAAFAASFDGNYALSLSELDSLAEISDESDSLEFRALEALTVFGESALDTISSPLFALYFDTLWSSLSAINNYRLRHFVYKPTVLHTAPYSLSRDSSIVHLELFAYCRDSIEISSARTIYRLLPNGDWQDSSLVQSLNDTIWTVALNLDSLGGVLEYRFVIIDDSGRYETWPYSGGFPDSTEERTHFVSIEPRLTVPLSDTAYVYAPGVITEDIEIGDGGVLYVLPAPVEVDSYVVLIDPEVELLLQSSGGTRPELVVSGTDSTEIRLECSDSENNWSGVTVFGGTLAMEYATVTLCDQPVYAKGYSSTDPVVRFQNVTFSDYDLPVDIEETNADQSDSSYVLECVFRHGDSTGVVLAYGALDFQDVTVDSCGDDGIMLSLVTDQLLSNVTVTNNGRYGVVAGSGASTARLSGCYIAFNGDTLPEIKVNSSSTVDVSEYAGNTVKDSTGVLFECAEVNDFDAELGSNTFVLADSTGKYFDVTSMSGPSYITGNTFFPESVNDTTFIDEYMKHDTLSKWVYSYLRAEDQMDEVIEDPSGSISFEVKAYVQNYLGTVANDTITEVGFKYRLFPDSANWTTYRQTTVESDSLYDWPVSVGDQGGLISYIWWAKDAHGRYLTSPAGADTTMPDSGATHYLSFEMSDTLISSGDSVVIWAPTTLTHNLWVADYSELVIKPWPGATDHTVTLAEGVSIRAIASSGGAARARIWIEGTESMPITLEAENDTLEWDQVNIHKGALYASYTTFRSNLIALESGTFGDNVLQLDYCTFESSDGWFYIESTDIATSYLRNCVFRDLGTSYGEGSFLIYNCDIEITDSWFYNNSGHGIVLYDPMDTEISGCNSIANDLSGLMSSGITSSVTVSCSEFSYNGGDTTAEVYLWDGVLDISGDAGNVFADKAGTLLEGPAMTSFVVDSGGNGFYLFDSTGSYIVTGDETDTMDVSGNLWYPWTPDTSIFQDYFDPDTSRFWDWSDPAEALAACGVGGMMSLPGGGSMTLVRPDQETYGITSHGGSKSRGSQVSKSAAKSTSGASIARKTAVNPAAYTEAVVLQKSRHYAEAKELYASFINQNPDHPQTEAALSRYAVSAKKSGKASGLSDYFERIASRSTNPRVRRAAKFLKLDAMANEGRVQEALTAYDEIIRTPATRHDSITAVIGASRILFYNQEQKLVTRHPENTPESYRDLCRRVIRLMSSERRSNGALDDQPVDAAVPTSYALYQNYPNPFNPTTEIRFDLPESIHAELKVFNILGQEVVTLVDDVRAAGAYRLLWDGKSAAGLTVASGVYVYQLKTPNFQSAKKMMLIR